MLAFELFPYSCSLTATPGQATFTTEFKGPYEADFVKRDELGVGTVVWSPCGEESLLSINTQVRVSPVGTDSRNLIAVDSTDLKLTQIYGLQWQKCKK